MNSHWRAPASPRPTVVLPHPATPITMMSEIGWPSHERASRFGRPALVDVKELAERRRVIGAETVFHGALA